MSRQPEGALFFGSEIKQLAGVSARQAGRQQPGDCGIRRHRIRNTAVDDVRRGSRRSRRDAGARQPLGRPGAAVPQSFWRPPAGRRVKREIRDVAEEFRVLFADSVKLQLRADVPVGVCLSGGLDSSAIYGQARRAQGASAVDAFSAAFDDPPFDERPFIKDVLDLHGGQLHLAFPDAEAFIRDCDQFVYHHDEPVGSLSQYAAWSVMARRTIGAACPCFSAGRAPMSCSPGIGRRITCFFVNVRRRCRPT